VLVSFEGAIVEGSASGNANAGNGPVVRVDRFVGVWPEEVCEAAMGNRPLVETRWQILSLGGTALVSGAQGSPPHLFFQAGEGGPRFTASAGCNTLAGGFEIEGDRLVFGRPVTTLMACPPPLGDHEHRLGEALGAARGWRIDGDRLALMGDDGGVIAELMAAETE
jgi:putative lipoprotein